MTWSTFSQHICHPVAEQIDELQCVNPHHEEAHKRLLALHAALLAAAEWEQANPQRSPSHWDLMYADAI